MIQVPAPQGKATPNDVTLSLLDGAVEHSASTGFTSTKTPNAVGYHIVVGVVHSLATVEEVTKAFADEKERVLQLLSRGRDERTAN